MNSTLRKIQTAVIVLTAVVALIGCHFFLSIAHAAGSQTGLAMVCNAPKGTAPFQAAQCQRSGYTRTYMEPVAGSYVLTYPTVKNNPQPTWPTDAQYLWQPWPVPATDAVLVCMKGIMPGTTFAANVPDPCTASEDDVNKPLVLATAVASTVPIATTPVTIPLPANMYSFSVTFQCPNGATPVISVPTVAAGTVTIAAAMCPTTTPL